MTVKRQSNKKKVAPEKFELDLRSDPEIPQIQNYLQILTEDSKSINAEVSEIRLGGIFQLLEFSAWIENNVEKFFCMVKRYKTSSSEIQTTGSSSSSSGSTIQDIENGATIDVYSNKVRSIINH